MGQDLVDTPACHDVAAQKYGDRPGVHGSHFNRQQRGYKRPTREALRSIGSLHLSGQQGKDVLRLFQGERLNHLTANES